MAVSVVRKATEFIRGETPNAIQKPTPAVRRKPDKGVPRTSKFGGTASMINIEEATLPAKALDAKTCSSCGRSHSQAQQELYQFSISDNTPGTEKAFVLCWDCAYELFCKISAAVGV